MRPVHRVFVTGATGFVGRAVVQALRGEGYVVRCLVRRGSEPDLRGVGAIERVEGDVLAPQLLDEGMAGCGAVIHLVGIIREHIATNTTFYRVHVQDRKSTRLNSSHSQISYAVFCLKKKKKKHIHTDTATMLRTSAYKHTDKHYVTRDIV